MIRTSAQTVTPEPVPAEAAPREEHIAPAPRVSVQAFCDTVEAICSIEAAVSSRLDACSSVRVDRSLCPCAISRAAVPTESEVALISWIIPANFPVVRVMC